MRKLVLVGLGLILSGSLWAQTETLIGSGNKYGGFGGPLFQFASVNNEFAFYSGGGGGLIINGQFYIGGFGMSLRSDHSVDVPVNGSLEEHYADFGFGGLWLGYIYKPSKLVHLNFSLPMGGGGIDFDRVGDGESSPIDDAVFVVNPSFGMEINISSWMKFNANVGYTVLAGANNNYMNSSAFNSPNLQLGLKFGYFAE